MLVASRLGQLAGRQLPSRRKRRLLVRDGRIVVVHEDQGTRVAGSQNRCWIRGRPERTPKRPQHRRPLLLHQCFPSDPTRPAEQSPLPAPHGQACLHGVPPPRRLRHEHAVARHADADGLHGLSLKRTPNLPSVARGVRIGSRLPHGRYITPELLQQRSRKPLGSSLLRPAPAKRAALPLRPRRAEETRPETRSETTAHSGGRLPQLSLVPPTSALPSYLPASSPTRTPLGSCSRSTPRSSASPSAGSSRTLQSPLGQGR